MNNLIKDFIIFSSGAKKDVLQACKEKGYDENSKFITVGITVILTGVFAAIAGGYAINRVFINEPGGWKYSVAFALLWGLMIYNLDRFTVQGIDKTSPWWRQLLISVPRIALAVIISIVISKPLEVKLFSDRLAYEIRKTKIYTDSLTAVQIKSNYDVGGKETEYHEVEAEYKEATEKAASKPDTPEYNELKSSYSTCRRGYRDLESINYPKIAKINSDISTIESQQSNYMIVDGQKKFYIGAQEKLDNLNRQKSRLNSAVVKKRDECYRIRKKYKDIEKAHEELWKQRKEDAESKKTSAKTALDEAKSEADKEIGETKPITKKSFTDNFITQLEALGRLTEKDETFRLINIFVILLFIMVETAPVFVKLFQTADMYDEELAMAKKKYKYKVQKEYEAFVRDEEEAFRLETEANEKIVSKLADAQVEIAEAVIKDWRDEEIEKTKS